MADEHLISLQPGTVIAGRYEVVKCLGAGSMGLVYACRNRELSGHLVAIKVLFPEVAQDKIAAARFRNEIFASYGVSHPNVVRAYEYIRDGELVAYTMEYVGGGDLADKLGRSDKPLSIADIIKYVAQMCSGVQAIHDAGIVHRDLKPENILLTKEGNIKIADFGIARTGHGPKLTEHGGVVGTIDYVSPEYMLESQVDWRSDIYALGILGYEMITGESPFRGDSVYATMTKRLKSDPKPPSSIRLECPPELDTIILKAMARDPQNRYQSAAEMFFALQALMPKDTPGSGTYLQVKTPGLSNFIETGPQNGTTHQIDEEPVLAAANSEPRQSLIENPAGMMAPVEEAKSRFERPGLEPGQVRVKYEDERESPRPTPGYAENYDQAESFEDRDPVRMERLLGNDDADRAPWGGHSDSPSVSLPPPTIDPNRLRRLSESVDQSDNSFWITLVWLMVAVLIGVGLGFAVIEFFVPSANDQGTERSRNIDIRVDNGD